ncbi:MAG: bacteriohemerythrin [Defluviitaleaceae bacterium]|nr:bacteriohemerythrin [Defluviitaleaceae bacterium]
MELKLTKNLETGIALVDQQHRELIDAVNGLEGMREKVKDPAVMAETMDFLATYCIMHFDTEEEIMRESNFPEIALHEKEHRLFVDKFVEYKDKFENEGFSDELFTDLSRFLKIWILKHIAESDLDMGKHYVS